MSQLQNKDRLLERFMEDPDKVFRDAGVQVEGSSSQQRVRTETDFTCGVCFEDYDKVETVALACEHRWVVQASLSFILYRGSPYPYLTQMDIAIAASAKSATPRI